MKKRIWYKVRSFTMAVLLAGGTMSGVCGSSAAADVQHTEDMEDTGILLEEEARWTEIENYRARVTFQIRGLRAWMKKADGGNENTEDPGNSEQNDENGDTEAPEDSGQKDEVRGAEDTDQDTDPSVQDGKGETGKSENTPDESGDFGSEEGAEAFGQEKETEGAEGTNPPEQDKAGGSGKNGSALDESATFGAEENPEASGQGKESEGREDEASPKQDGEEERAESEGTSEKNGDFAPAKSGEPGAAENAGRTLLELGWMGEKASEENDDFAPAKGGKAEVVENAGRTLLGLSRMGEKIPRRKQVTTSVQLSQDPGELTERSLSLEESAEDAADGIYLVTVLSPYFAAELEQTGEGIQMEEMTVQVPGGGYGTATKLTIPVDPAFLEERASEAASSADDFWENVSEENNNMEGNPSDMAEKEPSEEDICALDLPVILREPYRISGTAREYPVTYDQIWDLPQAGAGTCLILENQEERQILASAPPAMLLTEAVKGEFTLTLSDGGRAPSAGKTAGYEAVLRNTGGVVLKEISLNSSFSDERIIGNWAEAEGLTAEASGGALLEKLEPGEVRTLTVTAGIPEDFQGNLLHTVSAAAADPANPGTELRTKAAAQADVAPLKIDFSVSKSADRTKAAPGDTITYQICIRNTGERTLHSVLSTERFMKENISARFMEQEGVILSADKTQALIPQILPGEVYSMEAYVTLPENLQDGELINQVTVTAKETGSREAGAQSGVEIESPNPSETPGEQETGEALFDSASPPKTGDDSRAELWITLMFAAVLAAGPALLRGYFLRREKRKR